MSIFALNVNESPEFPRH